MKLRVLLAFAGLAIGFALPTFAQQKEPSLSEQDRQQIEALGKKNDEAWSKSDAAALATLFSEDALLVGPGSMISGREAIQKRYEDFFKNLAGLTLPKSMFESGASLAPGHLTNVSKIVELHPIDNNTAWAVGQWTQTGPGPNNTVKELHGNWATLNERIGDTWKWRLQIYNVAPSPSTTSTATPSPTTTPSNP
jgi:hypothetical protein